MYKCKWSRLVQVYCTLARSKGLWGCQRCLHMYKSSMYCTFNKNNPPELENIASFCYLLIWQWWFGPAVSITIQGCTEGIQYCLIRYNGWRVILELAARKIYVSGTLYTFIFHAVLVSGRCSRLFRFTLIRQNLHMSLISNQDALNSSPDKVKLLTLLGNKCPTVLLLEQELACLNYSARFNCVEIPPCTAMVSTP